MSTKMKIGATALLMSLAMIDQTFAGFLPPVEPVPEFDGASGIAVLALLVSVGAILFNRSRNS